ncbi:MAG: hypothetical protein AAGA54_29445 [Myxococcota bacterium]
MAVGNTDVAAPMLYASGPERAHPKRGSIDEVDSIQDPALRETVRRYLTHPSDAQQVSRFVLSVHPDAASTSNVSLAASLDLVEVVEGPTSHLLIELDGGTSGRTHTCEGPPDVTVRW